jgi:sulfatase modifying factor 1
MGNNPSSNKCDNCPVENITYDEAQAYCRKQSRLTDKTYRLPTEAEWEYAARGGNKSGGFLYSGSNDIAEVGWSSVNSGGKTHPVGQKQPNELGLCDMTGNVWEWCSDWYDDYYYNSSSTRNPQGASQGTFRVIRGGSWDSTPLLCRATYRSTLVPSSSYGPVGFRPVVAF